MNATRRGAKDTAPPLWTSMKLLQEGGFAGLLRSASCTPQTIAPEHVKAVNQCVLGLRALGKVTKLADHPDQAKVRVSIAFADAPTWSAVFDAADMPVELERLCQVLPLRPWADAGDDEVA